MTHIMSYPGTGSKSLKKPCGCGGGCGGAPCECPGAKCGDPCGCSDGLLVQPHFFAGQLLTDDDLQALTNYVLAKQRLHNRFVVGSGVACGLAVTCHPCDHGKVMVQPGYAIDCCGNDIYVPCPVELDINAMVRDLRFRQLGVDCGDPCADHAPGQNNSRKGMAAEKDQIDKSLSDCEPPVDRYCLYLVYCESATDPVAPYTTGDSCSSSCQPSRVREGYRFELRCPEKETAPPSLFDRVRCCLGDLLEADWRAGELSRTQAHMHNVRYALRSYADRQPLPNFSDNDLAILDAAKFDPQRGLSLEPGSVDVRLARGATHPQGEPFDDSKEFTEEVLRRSLDNVQTLGSAIARYRAMDDAQRRAFLEKHQETPQTIAATQELLKKALDEKSPIRMQIKKLVSPIDVASAEATVANTLKYTDANLQPEVLRSAEFYLYANNVVTSKQLVHQFRISWDELKSWLLRQMHECPPSTECSLLCETASIVVPAEEKLSDAMVSTSDALERAFLRYLLDCICSALLPSCPTCEDPAVKLACFEVKDCAVDNICNLERTFLISGPNLRYWLPFLHGLGQVLEIICCECSKKLDRPLVESGQFEPRSKVYASGTPLAQSLGEKPAYSNILHLIDFTFNLIHIVSRQPQLMCCFGLPLKGNVITDVGATLLGQLFKHSRAKEALQQLGMFESRGEPFAADRIRSAEKHFERLTDRVRDVEEGLDERLTASKLSSTSVITDLQASVEKLEAKNQQLVARLRKLERGPR